MATPSMGAIARTTPPLGWGTRIAYATSGVPAMIEQRGISAFLLIFYSQVMGLPAHMVATVLLIASVADSLFDPLVGHISDNFRSRLGRRHPFIYASIVPVAIGYWLLWSPPSGWSPYALSGYLLATLLTLRLFDTFFDLPSSALLPELTRDYDTRTTIVSLRTVFALLGGMLMTMSAYQIFLKENPDGTGGVLAHAGYSSYGLAAAAVMALAMLTSGLGTHSRIPFLVRPEKRNLTIRAMLREVGQTLRTPSFVALLAVGMLMAVANGARLALELYYNLYFWGLSQAQLSLLLLLGLAGTLPGAALAPWLSRRWGKRAVVTIVIVAGIAGNVGPVLGRLAGIMPPNGDPALFLILAADTIFTFCAATITTIMLSSMMNDVVEDVEVRTGRRSEGLLLAGDSFLRKLVSSLGIFVSGLMLTLIAFPRHAERNAVPPEIVAQLAYGYLPITLLYAGAFFLLRFYRIDRSVHDANMEILSSRPSGEP